MTFLTDSPIVQNIMFDAYGEAIGTTTVGGATRVLQVDVAQSVPLTTTTSSGGYGGQVEGRAAAGIAPVGNPVYMGGTDGSVARAILTDSLGRVITAPAGSATSTAGFAFGDVTLSAITTSSVRRTTYTEQSSNAQRSIVSASASDASAGTGARTVLLTYYTSTGTGPLTETITMNGTTPVNTVASNICFIEKMEVVTVGSNASNVGIISLKAATAGGGATIGTIAATDNITFWAHHYVPTGKTCYITSISVAINGGGALFFVKSLPIGVSNAVEKQVSDFIRESAQAPTTTRLYGTAINIVGPARLTTYVTTEAGTTLAYRASFDFYDQ